MTLIKLLKTLETLKKNLFHMNMKKKQNRNLQNLQQRSTNPLKSKTKLHLQKSYLQLKNLLPPKSLKPLQKLKTWFHPQNKTFLLKKISSNLQVTKTTYRSQQKGHRLTLHLPPGDLPVAKSGRPRPLSFVASASASEEENKTQISKLGPSLSSEEEKKHKNEGKIKTNSKPQQLKCHYHSYS